VRNLILVLAVTFLLAPCVYADTIYSNLGSGSTFKGNAGYSILPQQSLAMPFTVPTGPGFNLSQIDIALTGANGFPAIVKLLTNSGGLPGAVIPSATWTLNGLPQFPTTGSIQSGQTVSGISGIVLSGGTQYWLAAFQPLNNPSNTWLFNAISQFDSFASSSDGGTTWRSGAGLTPAFDVQGTPVAPVSEPRTVLLLGVGLIGLVALSRR
jgi:hypothetical protein